MHAPFHASDEDTIQLIEIWLKAPEHLALGPALETRFERDTAHHRCRQAARTLLIGLCGYDLFLVSDRLMLPDMFALSAVFRLGIITPLGIALALWMQRVPRRRTRECAQALLIVVATIGVALLDILSESPSAANYQFGLPLGILFINLLSGMQFQSAVVSTVICVTAYVGAIGLLHPFPANAITLSLVLQVCSALIAMMSSARMHLSERRSYLLTLRETLRSIGFMELSRTDALTNAGNRRAFDAAVEEIWRGDGDLPVAAMMIDIDHFKRYNDAFGHQLGDRCLSAVATAINDVVQPEGGLLCRYGGDEFAVLLPGKGLRDAVALAERARGAVLQLAIPQLDGTDQTVTLSIGVASLKRGASGPTQLLNIADQALYAAKLGGRNRVSTPLGVVADKTPHDEPPPLTPCPVTQQAAAE